MTIAGNETNINSRFTFDSRTEIYQSCSVTWRNINYVFGGAKQPQQISRLSSCGLTRVTGSYFLQLFA